MNYDRIFKHKIGMVFIVTFVTLLWGSAFPFIKLSYPLLEIQPGESYEQLLFAGYRFFLASSMIFLFMFIKERKISFSKGSLKPLIQIGLFQTTLQYLFFYIGLSHSSGIQGSIIAGGTGTFFAVLLAHFFYQNDSITARKIIGLFIGFIGVILANIPNGSLQIHFGFGEFFLLIASFMGALGNIYAKKYSHQFSPLYLTTFQMMLGSIVLLLIGGSQVGFVPFEFHVSSTIMLIYLSFLSAAGFALWNTLLKFHKVSIVSMYMFLIPVFGVMLSSILLGERIHSIIFLALLFVVSGIVIVNREKQTKTFSRLAVIIRQLRS